MYLFHKKAIVRPPGRSYINCLSTHPLKQTIDVDKAKAQHEFFCKMLERIGFELIRLKADENYPDGCFVEDCAVIDENIAVICRLGPNSRKGEERDVEKILNSFKEIRRISSPGILEGGNVLKTDKEIFIGVSERTNVSAINQLKGFLRKKTRQISLENVVHLKEICTYLGRNIMLVSKNYSEILPFRDYEVIEISPEESYAANCVSYGDFVIAPKGYKQTAKKMEKRGFKIIEMETSEFEKGNGGITCLALFF